MNANEILKKTVIAFNLRRADVRDIFMLAGFDCSLSQVGYYLAAAGNKNYKELDFELLREFMDALVLYSRGTADEPNLPPMAILNSIESLAERGQEEALQSLVDCVAKARAMMAAQDAAEQDPRGAE